MHVYADEVNDTFDAYGSSLNDWVTTGSTVSLVGSTDKDLSIVKSVSSGNTFAEKYVGSLSGTVTVQALVQAATTANWKMAPYVVDSAGNNAVSVVFNNGNLVTYDGATQVTVVSGYSTSAWYKIKLVINTDTDTYDIYVNDVKKNTSPYALRTPVKDVQKLLFGIGDGHTGTLYVDEVSVQ